MMNAGMAKAIILGPGRGVRHLDPNRSYPSSLRKLGKGGRVLDWILESFAAMKVDRENVIFVGGYHLEKIIGAYPGLKYYFQPDWEQENEIAALRLALNEIRGPSFLCTTHVVFRSEALAALQRAGADIALGIQGSEKNGRWDPRLLDLAWFDEKGVEELRLHLSRADGRKLALKDLFGFLAKNGVRFQLVDISENCAEINDSTSLSHFIFGTKSQTLKRLRHMIRRAVVLDQVNFLVRDWKADPRTILAQIHRSFADQPVVVRSSAAIEDSWNASQAGLFKSVPCVNPSDANRMADAINTVIDTYAKAGGESPEGRHEVFIQPYVSHAAVSGVVLTRALETGAPYYVVNMDRCTGRTDTVTSGSAFPIETFVVYKHSQGKLPDPVLDIVIPMVQELEEVIGHDSLDIEFAINHEGQIFLFQVRPLVNRKGRSGLADADFEDELGKIRLFVKTRMAPHPFLKGRTTLLSNMSDWNPAEMLGVTPRPLALSLYQVLITDFAWAEARRQMGYRDVVSEPLLVALAGLPYVDVRASFNSFLPATLDENIAERLVNVYLDHLKSNPVLHDKIEFEVALTCLAFDFERHAARLRNSGLDVSDIDELRKNLLSLTDHILLGKIAPIGEQISRVRQLAVHREAVQARKNPAENIPQLISWLTNDCIRLGTIPFAILARDAFISMAILKSMRERGVFSLDEYHTFLNEIPSVATEVSQSLMDMMAGVLSKEEFILKYGHLRPGTYDILSSNYAQTIHMFQSGEGTKTGGPSAGESRRPDPQIAKEIFLGKEGQISRLLREHGFGCDTRTLLEFVLNSIPGREWAKLEFTKNVNDILELVAEFARGVGISREEASYLSIERILNLATDSPSCALDSFLKRALRFEMKRHLLMRAMRLPDLIRGAADLEGFPVLECQPNFITDQRVIGEVINLEDQPPPHLIQGRIPLIRSADPGYDWIFCYRPAGLVTQYGGVASHMTIRAAEFGLPSAIGCGDLIFERLCKAKVIQIDCANHQIGVLQ
jgi:glutamine kinase